MYKERDVIENWFGVVYEIDEDWIKSEKVERRRNFGMLKVRGVFENCRKEGRWRKKYWICYGEKIDDRNNSKSNKKYGFMVIRFG